MIFNTPTTQFSVYVVLCFSILVLVVGCSTQPLVCLTPNGSIYSENITYTDINCSCRYSMFIDGTNTDDWPIIPYAYKYRCYNSTTIVEFKYLNSSNFSITQIC